MESPQHNTAIYPSEQKTQWTDWIMLLLILLLSLTLFQPVLDWLFNRMTLTNNSGSAIALTGVLMFIALRYLTLRPTINIEFSGNFPAMLIWLSAGFLYLFNEYRIGFHALSAALFFAFIYGLSGHFLRPLLWRRSFIPICLMILLLPIGDYVDVFLGFPLRLISAEWVAQFMRFLDIAMVSTQSVLQIENRAAVVDVECSGVRSLWIGLMAYMLLTWLHRLTISRAWLLIMLIFIAMLIFANLGRIILLVWLDVVWQLPQLARIIHSFIGLAGFSLALAATILLLSRYRKTMPPAAQAMANPCSGNRRQAALTISLLVLLISLYQPIPATSVMTTQTTLQQTNLYQISAIELDKVEKSFFTRQGAVANKYQISIEGRLQPAASVVLVSSRQWQAHHIPDQCYLSQGFVIHDHNSRRLDDNNLIRDIRLTHESQSEISRYASYWFQAEGMPTADYMSRVSDGITSPGRKWTLVSILWNESATPAFQRQVMQDIYLQLQENPHD